MTDVAKDLHNLANTLEQSKDLAEKNKIASNELEAKQVQLKNVEADLGYLRGEVAKVNEELAGLKVKQTETLKVHGEELSKIQIDVALAKEELKNVLETTAKEKSELDAKHAELDDKIQKALEGKKVLQALKDEKNILLAEIKKESAKLEDNRAKAEGQVNEMNSLNAKFQSKDAELKQREESTNNESRNLANKLDEINKRDALIRSLEAALAVREAKLKENEGLVDAKVRIVEDKETYIVKLIEEARNKGVDPAKFEPKVEVAEPVVEPVVEKPVAGKKKK